MSDVELLARLIQCEAGGEGLDGMRAVASVVMNRVRTLDGEYGRQNTVREVIYAPRQFECVSHTFQNINNMSPEAVHYEIAEWAISGGRLGATGMSLWFYNPFTSPCNTFFPSEVGAFHIRIGNHCFFSPTQLYSLT